MAISQQQNTALLLFTRSQHEEARVKDFSSVHSLRSNSLIAGHLISHAEKTARSTGLPCFVINSAHQHGNTFGEKLSDAFQQIFKLGFENVIAIGNDCPSLSAQDLRTAAFQLTSKQAVLGPASDGGLYLIGLNKSAFHAISFSALPWETAIVQDMMQVYLSDKAITYILSYVKEDIDFGKQLNSVLAGSHISLHLRTSIRSIIASIVQQFSKQFQHPITINHRIYTSLRAPPVY